MNGFYDYFPKLIQYMEKHNPKYIFEYGVGMSSIVLAKLYPDSRIYSIEYSFKWYLINEFVRILRGAHNLTIAYIPNKQKFIEYHLDYRTKYDFYILDSPEDYGERKEILSILRKLRVPILIHDAKKVIGAKQNTMVVNNHN